MLKNVTKITLRQTNSAAYLGKNTPNWSYFVANSKSIAILLMDS